MSRFAPLMMVLLFLAPLATETAAAHTLGIDPVELTDLGEGQYQLIAKVPAGLQSAIAAPLLPDDCDFSGDPMGTRGTYTVIFEFACPSMLVAGQTIVLPWRRDGVMMTVTWKGQEPITRLVTREGNRIEISLTGFRAGSGGVAASAKRYTALGIEHILSGIDHLLFVFALLFVVGHGWPLVRTITAFTVAHSITLAFSTLGLANLPTAPVEAAIALSIVFLCAEIVRGDRNSITFRHTWVVAFSFGLLHGFGFAGALAAIGLPAGEVPLALLFFNVGVEIGQLLFVAAALLLFKVFRSVATPAAKTAIVYVAGVSATYWFIDRLVPVAFAN
ncbi:MAG: HupE/UreJ family protein [Woeseiaceae bacterium]